MSKAKKTHNKVLFALKNKPATRLSDWELMAEVWRQEGFYLSNTQVEYLKERCSKPASISRSRRLVKTTNPELTDPKTESKRFDLFGRMRNSAGQAVDEI